MKSGVWNIEYIPMFYKYEEYLYSNKKNLLGHATPTLVFFALKSEEFVEIFLIKTLQRLGRLDGSVS